MFNTTMLKQSALSNTTMVSTLIDKQSATREELLQLQRAAKRCHPDVNWKFRELLSLLERVLYPNTI